jgi:uncharacterized SAM-binding protein YcdF (DUF218 family)
MKNLRRALVLTTGAALLLFTLGFILFATVVTRPPAVADPRADGIVVLTGESRRIAEGARLLKEGRAERMLISGVFRHTGKRALLKISGLPEQKFDCCVDVGYAAHDTAGNADEARSWATERRYGSLIIVTATYHMPRSLAELSLALPAARLIPHPVTPAGFPDNSRWWLSPAVARKLFSEYIKFLPAAAHLTVARALGGGQPSSLAEMPVNRPAGI